MNNRILPIAAACLCAAFVATAAFAQQRRGGGGNQQGPDRSSTDRSSSDRSSTDRTSPNRSFTDRSSSDRSSSDRSSSDRSSQGRPSFDRPGVDRFGTRTGPTAMPTTRPAFSADVSIDRYDALTARNVFMKDRRPPRLPDTRPFIPQGPRPVERRPEQLVRLTGLALHEGRNVAFIENIRTGATERKVQGDAVAGGTIVYVDLIALEYELNSKRVRVEIGHDFAGEVASVATADASPSTSTTDSAATTQPSDSGVPLDPTDPTLTPEQRLKAKRAAEQRSIGR